MARIEVREFVLGQEYGINLAIHQFLVKYNDNGTREELHGVAIDPTTRQFDQAAIKRGEVLKVAAHPPTPIHPLLTVEGFNTLYNTEQRGKILLDGTKEEIDARWDAAIRAAERINIADDWKYELKGGGLNDHSAGNSNSIVATLENIMGFTAVKITPQLPVPGLEKNLLPQNEHTDLYNAEWGSWSSYEPDGIDIIGRNMAATLTNAAEGDCTIS